MAGLAINHAVKSFGDTAVLKGVDLEVADGQFCVIVGASGCGKSTLLRAIAGLEQLDSGSISIGDRRVDGLPPAERGIAMVFQSYALYPHLTVYENMAFALRLAKRPQAEVDEAVQRAAAILGLGDYLGAQTGRAFGRAAATGRDRPRDRPPTRGVPVRRTACRTSTPACATACGSNSPRSTVSSGRPPST